MSEYEVDGSVAKSTTATSDKKIQDSPRNEGAAIYRDTQTVILNWFQDLTRKEYSINSEIVRC